MSVVVLLLLLLASLSVRCESRALTAPSSLAPGATT